MARYKQFFLIVMCVCATAFGMDDQKNVQHEAFNTHFLNSLEEIRRTNGFNQASIPADFDAALYGEMLGYNPQTALGYTHLGGMYHYRDGSWHTIRQGDASNHEAFIHDVYEHDLSKAGAGSYANICWHVHRNSFFRYAYDHANNTLVYPIYEDRPLLRRTVGITHCNRNLYPTTLAFEQNNKVVRMHNVSLDHSSQVRSLFFSKDASYCACVIESNDKVEGERCNAIKVHCFKKLEDGIYEKKACDVLTQGNIPSEKAFMLTNYRPRMFWREIIKVYDAYFNHNYLNVLTAQANGISNHWIISPDYGERAYQLVVDGGNLEVPLGFVYPLPVLHKKCRDSSFEVHVKDLRISLCIHGLEKNQFSKEIRQLIMHIWSYADKKLRNRTSFVYGKNFSVEEKKALSVLHKVATKGPKEALKEYPKEDLWLAVKYARIWQEFSMEATVSSRMKCNTQHVKLFFTTKMVTSKSVAYESLHASKNRRKI